MKEINNFIPFDDLHWDEYEQKYRALSDEELNTILLDCVQNLGIVDTDTLHKIIENFTILKTSKLIFDKYMSGKILIDSLKQEEVAFKPA